MADEITIVDIAALPEAGGVSAALILPVTDPETTRTYKTAISRLKPALQLDRVNNTEDIYKPVSIPQAAAIASIAQANFMGIADLTTNGSTAPSKGFWVTLQPGTYPGLGGVVVGEGEMGIISKDEGTYTVQTASSAAAGYTDSKVATMTVSEVRAITSNPPEHLLTTDMGTGTWFRDDLDITSPENIADRLRTANGVLFRRAGHIRTAKNFGAACDGITDDTEAIQAALDTLAERGGGTLTLDGNVLVSNVSINSPNVNIDGGGYKIMGYLTIGNEVEKVAYNIHLTKLIFETPSSGIILYNCRRVSVSLCFFNGCSRGIQVDPRSTGFHGISQTTISNSVFLLNEFAVYSDLDVSAWDVLSDWIIDCCVIAHYTKSAFSFRDGIDGVRFGNTTLLNSNTVGESAIVLGDETKALSPESDWTIFENCNIFETKKNVVLANNPKLLNINNCNFGWNGQAGFYSLIKATGSYAGSLIRFVKVNGNTFDAFSGHVIEIPSSWGGIVSSLGNLICYQDTFTNYTGAVDLSTVDHYEVYSTQRRLISCNNETFPSFKSNLKQVYNGGITGNVVRNGHRQMTVNYQGVITVVAGIALKLCSFRDAQTGTGAFSGQVEVCVTSATTSNANTATVTGSAMRPISGSAYRFIEISNTSAPSTTDPAWPRFYLYIDNSDLYLMPVRSMAGTFYVNIKTTGNIQFYI